MYFSPINSNGHTANAPNNHYSPSTTNNAQQPTPPPAPSSNCSPTPLPPPTQRRKPTTNILQYILHRSTATRTSPEPTNTPTIHETPHNRQLTATTTRPNMNRPSTNNNATHPRQHQHMTPAQPTDMNNAPDTTCSNMNSTPPTNESHSRHPTPTTHIPSDHTVTFNQQHSATDQRPNLHSLPTDVNDKTTNANSNNTPPNINTIHHCHSTATELTININSPTFPSHRTSNIQAPIIDTNINSTSNTDNESTNSYPAAMDTMNTSLYSLNPPSTPTPDCEAVPDTVG